MFAFVKDANQPQRSHLIELSDMNTQKVKMIFLIPEIKKQQFVELTKRK